MMVLPLGDGKVKVHNNGLFSNETVSEICGFATVPNPDEPGVLLVEFPTSKKSDSGKIFPPSNTIHSIYFRQVRPLIPAKYLLLLPNSLHSID